MSDDVSSFGPCWDPPGPTDPAAPDDAPPGLIDAAVRVGQRLASDMQWAEERTGGWADDRLTTALVEFTLSDCLATLSETGCWGRANQMAANEFWRAAEQYLATGWLQNRARTKPRGYAGDYLLLARIWDGTATDHPLGRVMDRFFLSHAAPQAVRARLEQTAAALTAHCLHTTRRAYRVVSIGSGPGVEIESAARSLPESVRNRLRVTLLDFDGEALDHAQARLGACMSPNAVTARRENLHRLGETRTMTEVGPFDLLICTGLFDYLVDDTAAGLLARCWENLAPGGRLLVGNFAPHHPTRAYMEWIGAWYLIYRTPAELRQLATLAGLPAESCRIGAERTGCDLFLSAVKPV